MTAQRYLSNQFLIALPNLKGDYFEGTITLLIEHSDEGAFGLVLNKPADLNLSELVSDDFPDRIPSLPVLQGGPVGEDHLFFLHSTDKLYAESHRINDDVALTTTPDLLQDLSRASAPYHTLALIGYAGWSSAQLEYEIGEDVWLVAPFSREVMFDTPYQDQPAAAAANMGVDLNLLKPGSDTH